MSEPGEPESAAARVTSRGRLDALARHSNVSAQDIPSTPRAARPKKRVCESRKRALLARSDDDADRTRVG